MRSVVEIVVALLALGAVAFAAMSVPDLIRYIKMSRK
jgi:hypothetical protein